MVSDEADASRNWWQHPISPGALILVPEWYAARNSNETRPRVTEPATLPKCTIVLADDDDDFRSTVAEALRAEGAHVIEASGGEAAIAAVDGLARSRDGGPALVIMDLMMPVMSGIETLQRLRRSHRWARLPVVVMTAVNDPMLPVRLDVPVVFKPNIDPLLKAVRQMVGAWSPLGGTAT